LLVAVPEIVPKIKALGYVWVACDLEGYRSGSMNEAL
jgi:PP-loop superfamily ATP-utilizing enzyme